MPKTGLTLAVVVLLGLGILVFFNRSTQTLHARLGGEAFVFDVANTNALRERGLSGRDRLGPGTGILFMFPKDDTYGFWMKDMRFPIDIIWLDSNYRVVDVKKDATPASYPEIFVPVVPARYVVEVGAGFFAEHDLGVGDTIEILR